MGDKVDQHCLDTLILTARTQNGWLDRPVSDEQLRQLYDIMKQGPTSANTCPARILFLRTPAAKARLLPALAPGGGARLLHGALPATRHRGGGDGAAARRQHERHLAERLGDGPGGRAHQVGGHALAAADPALGVRVEVHQDLAPRRELDHAAR